MGLVNWIVAGLGWELGKEAAQEGIAAVRKAGEPEAPLTPRERKRRAKAEAARERQHIKAEAKAEKARAREHRRAEEAIDNELAALKKDVHQER